MKPHTNLWRAEVALHAFSQPLHCSHPQGTSSKTSSLMPGPDPAPFTGDLGGLRATSSLAEALTLKMAQSNAAGLADRPDVHTMLRCATMTEACKKAVEDLRADVKVARSHREKCSILLGAATTAVLTLEQVRGGVKGEGG